MEKLCQVDLILMSTIITTLPRRQVLVQKWCTMFKTHVRHQKSWNISKCMLDILTDVNFFFLLLGILWKQDQINVHHKILLIHYLQQHPCPSWDLAYLLFKQIRTKLQVFKRQLKTIIRKTIQYEFTSPPSNLSQVKNFEFLKFSTIMSY